jgi:hypothetical protein
MFKIDNLLTLELAAAKLHISVRTLRTWRYQRRIPFTRLGRRLYLDAGVIEQLLDANVISPLASPSSRKPQRQGGVQKEGDE